MSAPDQPIHTAARAARDAMFWPCISLVVIGIVLAIVSIVVPSEHSRWLESIALACVVVAAVPAAIVFAVLRLSKRGEG